MDTNTQLLWKQVLGAIEHEVSRANFLTLFKNTVLVSLSENTATVGAPSPMIIDLIQKRYITLIKNALQHELGKDIQVVFITKAFEQTNGSEKQVGPLFANQIQNKPLVIGHLPRVRSEYTFQNLAVSSSNQLAYISAVTVAQNIGKMYNPLFIYGPVGVGKTHIMQAVANDVYQKDPARKIIYITSEEFTNEVVEAIRTNQTQAMKKRFRSAYLLIIDDVQFIAGKDRVQEELFHTFNILIDNGSQIVLTSDRPPNEIKKLEERLSSRFSGGLTVDIETPDFELRTAILLIKAKKYGFELSIDVAKIIAEKTIDARSLEGVLLRIITEANAHEGPITSTIAIRVLLGNKQEDKGVTIHPDDIIKKICFYYSIKPTQIKGPRRDASLVRARQIAMYLLKKELGLTFVEIGNILGGRDHTTIMYGVDKVEKSVETRTYIYEDILGITKILRE